MLPVQGVLILISSPKPLEANLRKKIAMHNGNNVPPK
jgi:hypothetical protein